MIPAEGNVNGRLVTSRAPRREVVRTLVRTLTRVNGTHATAPIPAGLPGNHAAGDHWVTTRQAVIATTEAVTRLGEPPVRLDRRCLPAYSLPAQLALGAHSRDQRCLILSSCCTALCGTH